MYKSLATAVCAAILTAMVPQGATATPVVFDNAASATLVGGEFPFYAFQSQSPKIVPPTVPEVPGVLLIEGFSPQDFTLTVEDASGMTLLSGIGAAILAEPGRIEWSFQISDDATGQFGTQTTAFATFDPSIGDPFGPTVGANTTARLVVGNLAPIPLPASVALYLAALGLSAGAIRHAETSRSLK